MFWNFNIEPDDLQFQIQIARQLDRIKSDYDSRIRKTSKLLQLKKQMNRVYTRNSVLFCVDVEAWEHNQRYITEIGIAIYDPRGQKLALVPNIETCHIVINENRDVSNGEHVPDHRTNFSGDTSYLLSLKQARELLQSLIDHYFDPYSDINCSLVGHDLNGDIKWLRQLGVEIADNVRKLDTKTLFSYTHGTEGASLKNALSKINQPYAFLHNAGNDAYYTILLALKLCDPSVRKVLDFDTLDSDEEYGAPIRYPKTKINESTLRTISVQNLVDQIIRED